MPGDSICKAINFLLKECKQDKTRDNISKDFGFTGDHNPDLKRKDPELRGLCCPNVHARTFDPKLPWIKDLFCYVSKRLIKLSDNLWMIYTDTKKELSEIDCVTNFLDPR